jgi:multidrug resistance protein, MATE family
MSDAAPANSTAAPTIDPHPMREMLRIAGPTVATMSSYTLMTFVDKWLVSHIGPEPIYVGAQGNGGLVSWIAISLGHGLLMIINTFVAQNFGAGKAQRGPAYAWNGVWLSLLYWLAVLLPLAMLLPRLFAWLATSSSDGFAMDPRQATMSASYGSILLYGACITMATRCFSQFFYGMQKPGIVMIAGVCANILNVVLSCILVYGNGPTPAGLGWFGEACGWIARLLGIAPMGIAGSALGTIAATLLELLIPLAVFLGPAMHKAYGTRTAWRPSLTHIKDIFRLGWPAGLMMANEMICWGFFMVYLVSRFGAHHTTAGWVAHQYMSLSFMPAVGISVAVTALVGKYQGMGRSDLAAQRAWLGVRIALIYMGICAAIFVLFPRALMALFIDRATDPKDVETLISLGTKFLIATAAFQLFDAVAMVLSGALRGAGDTLVPGVATIISSWGIIVGGGLLLLRLFPQSESMSGWIAAATYIAVLCVFLLVRFVMGAWKRMQVVKE